MSTAAPTTTDVVFVPGAFTGAWMFADVIQLLDGQGIGSQVVELASVGGSTGTGSGFQADVDAVRSALDALDAPVVLAAHSYGGAVATAAAAGPHPNVRELVYLAATVPASGESFASTSAAVTPEDQESPIQFDDQGVATFPREVARQALLNDADDDRAAEALDQMKPQDMTGGDTPIETAAWTQIPYVYIAGEQDLLPRAIAPNLLDGAAQVLELPAGHCIHWTQPQLVADALVGRVR